MRPRACLALPLVVVGLLVSHPGRVAARTVLLMPEVFPDAPVRPLLWVSSPPRHEEYAYTSAAGQVDCDLYLPARPEVDPSRVGIFGFSAGGSLVLLAAETELGRQQIAFVNIFGAYYDAGDLLRQVAEDRIEADGGSEDWEPDP